MKAVGRTVVIFSVAVLALVVAGFVVLGGLFGAIEDLGAALSAEIQELRLAVELLAQQE